MPSPDLDRGLPSGSFDDTATSQLPARRPDLFAVILVDGHDVLLCVSRLRSDHSLQVLRQDHEVFNPQFGQPDDPRRIAVTLADILSRFQRAAELAGAAVRAVATQGFRTVPNHIHLLKHLPRVTRVALEMISERDVARLVCLGALRDRRSGERSLLIDMGDEVTSVVLANADQPVALWNLAIGTARFVAAGEKPATERDRLSGRSWRQQIQQTLALGHLDAIRGAAREAVLLRSRPIHPTALLAPAQVGAPGNVAGAAIAGAVAGALLREVAAYLHIPAVRHRDNPLPEGILIELSRALTASAAAIADGQRRGEASPPHPRRSP